MNKIIFIVDDDPTLLESIQILLEDEGYAVVKNIDGLSLAENMKTTRPDLILLDLRLPGESGEAIAVRLKKDTQTKNIPIIMVSANHNAESIAKNAGTEDFIPKPFEIDMLLSKVKLYIH